MSKVQPVIRRRYCVCGRPCGDVAPKVDSVRDSSVHGASNEPSAGVSSAVLAEKSAAPSTTPGRDTAFPSDTLTLLQLKVRALEKYKANYELLCSQVAELNTQVGLQLQRHEVDVTTLHATITTLQTTNASLQKELLAATQQLQTLQATSEKDRTYANGVHTQLTTVAELLKAAEKRLKEQDADHQRASDHHRETAEDAARLAVAKQALESQVLSLREQLAQQADSEKLRRKCRVEIKQLKLELEQLREELEQQRALTRQAKRQAKQNRDERETLARQVENIKADGSQLAAILETQRDEMARQDKKVQRWKKAAHESEAKLRETLQSLEDVEAQFARVQEELVTKNARVEQLLTEAKASRQRLETTQSDAMNAQLEVERLETQLARVQHEYASFQREQTECAERNEAKRAQEIQRRYHDELRQMKRLLSLNQQRTTESTHDMQVLKQELGSVQLLLKQCHGHQRAALRREEVGSTCSSGSSSEDHSWRRRRQHQRMNVEKAVLQTAIMDQVNEAW